MLKIVLEILSFSEKRIAITGKFKIGSRDVLKNLVISNGGIYVSAISSNTDYLVFGGEQDNTKESSKIKNAQEFEVRIINEKEFLHIIDKF
jgi:DNA ligase (NAD+)